MGTEAFNEEWGIYKFEVIIEKKKVVFRDSMKLLPGSLRSLGESLCPGAKGDVDHSTVCMSNLDSRKEELVNYMI